MGLLWLAGLLLFLPGFLSDIAGLLLLLPPVRALVRGTLGRRLGRRVVVMRGYGGAMPRDVVPGEIVREDQTAGSTGNRPVTKRRAAPTGGVRRGPA